MVADSVGLAYTASGGRIIVHYPVPEPDRKPGSRYGTGFDIGPIPESYWRDPPNEMTRERAAIWRKLLDCDAAPSA